MKKTKMLKKNYEFRNVLSKGKYYSGKYLEAYIKENHTEINYLGLAINTKIAKAVVRNRIKRLLRECYSLSENKINTGNSIVFLWKKGISVDNAKFDNIMNDILLIFDKANI